MRINKEIGSCLQWSFRFCALLICLIGIVCIYSWNKQNQQIHYALEDYIPKIQSSTRLDENLNILFNEFNQFAKSDNIQSRLLLKERILLRLKKLNQLSEQLPAERQLPFKNNINKIEMLLAELEDNLSAYHIVLNQLSETQTYIYWLHDDFNQEVSSLIQDISLQQTYLLDQLKNNSRDQQDVYKTFNRIHEELNFIANLTLTENKVIKILEQMTDKTNLSNLDNNIHYLTYLNQSNREQLSDLTNSMVTLRQIIQELFNIGLSDHQLPIILEQYNDAMNNLNHLTEKKDDVLNTIKETLEQQLDNDHGQLIQVSNKVRSASNMSMLIIMITIVIVILFILILNQLYIRPKIISRLTILNRSVIELSQGNLNAKISIDGEDELGRIARLLRQSIDHIKKQTQQLEAEIIDRILIEKHLRETQDDLIQEAKMAVVGKTITTLAHEINQPLNALSIYLYTAATAIKQLNTEECNQAIEQSQKLLIRIKNIITQLRVFSKRSNSDEPLKAVDLVQVINQAWGIIALNKTTHLTLTIPEQLETVLGNDIRYEQVFVNIFTNSIDACENKQAKITIDKMVTDKELFLYIHDNGVGWPLSEVERLLTPFTSHKAIGLGIGLSLSQSIMQQSHGELYIASTMNNNALIVLKFLKYNSL